MTQFAPTQHSNKGERNYKWPWKFCIYPCRENTSSIFAFLTSFFYCPSAIGDLPIVWLVFHNIAGICFGPVFHMWGKHVAFEFLNLSKFTEDDSWYCDLLTHLGSRKNLILKFTHFLVNTWDQTLQFPPHLNVKSKLCEIRDNYIFVVK
jgi:hypothetical protein